MKPESPLWFLDEPKDEKILKKYNSGTFQNQRDNFLQQCPVKAATLFEN